MDDALFCRRCIRLPEERSQDIVKAISPDFKQNLNAIWMSMTLESLLLKISIKIYVQDSYSNGFYLSFSLFCCVVV